MKKLTHSFGIYFDPKQTTSGQRFFGNLCKELSKTAIELEHQPSAVLFNVSSPISEIVKAKIRGQKIILRIDGLYYDRLSPYFADRFSWPLKKLFSLGVRFSFLHNFLAHIANFINQNYGAFTKIVFADLLIYQSLWSKKAHQIYFPNKPHEIIINGAIYNAELNHKSGDSNSNEFKLVVIYDDWKPSKRMYELIQFVLWMKEEQQLPVVLTIIGYTGKIPHTAPSSMKDRIENSSFIKVIPRFLHIDKIIQKSLLENDIYITFANRDPCPNVVVEAMSYGLPVVGFASGGLPDIVKNAGVLLQEHEESFFYPYRYESDFPIIDNEKVLEAVIEVKNNLEEYRLSVQQRFVDELGLDVVAKKYLRTIESFL